MPSTGRPRGNSLFIIAIFVAMLAGGLLGALLGRELPLLALVGDLFLAGLKMMIVPLVGSSMIVGVASLGDVRRLGRLGGLTLVYYLSTTLLAAALGLLLVNLIHPGAGVDATSAALEGGVHEYSFLDVLRGIVPPNLFKALAEGQMLPLIFFSLFFGAMLSTVGEKGAPVLAFFDGIFQVSLRMVHLVVATAPLGVFALVATRLGAAGGWTAFATEFRALGLYALTVMLGLLLHGAVTLPAVLATFGRRSPLRFVRDMLEPIAVSFSTASSSATLPVTMEAVRERAGVDGRVGNFVLPLGATVNMDGTALYEAIAAVFIAQSYGVALTLPVQLVIIFTATLAAVGAAGIPQAGLVTMVMVLQTAGLPAEGIGMILAIDWFLDRCRTTVNVWGDAVGAAVIARHVRFESPEAVPRHGNGERR
ncbi:MAG: dicarboxylate/amino acid:cation symporter [Candidatus Krumholzibacteriia bacterium]